MGLFDSLTGASTAKKVQRAEWAAGDAIQEGMSQAKDTIWGGRDAATGTLTKYLDVATGEYERAADEYNTLDGVAADLRTGVAAYDPIIAGYQKGATLNSDALGINGADGVARARSAFTTGPGYEFQVNEAVRAAERAAAARGMNGSGNTVQEIGDRASGLASGEWNGWLNRLQGYDDKLLTGTNAKFSAQKAVGDVIAAKASGRANAYTGIGNANLTTGNNLADVHTGAAKDVAGLQVESGKVQGEKEMSLARQASAEHAGKMGLINTGLSLAGGVLGLGTGGGATIGGSIFGKLFGK